MSSVLVTLLLSMLLCGVYRRIALARALLDRPNERSAHSQPIPHGGGLPLFVAFAAGLLFACWLGVEWGAPYLVITGVALLLMTLGIADDLRGLSVRLRMLSYSVLCVLVACVLTQSSTAALGSLVIVIPLVALALLWILNLYNFMDGIDGLAAIQTALACSMAGWLSWDNGHTEYALFCLLLAAAHTGFLPWNFPPARLFMGDAGSIPTGFLVAALLVLGGVQGQLNPLCWLVLLAPFITDATWTLLWRLADGQAVTQPHKTHAYQRLSRHWRSHLKVDGLLLALQVLWLFPVAALVHNWPEHALYLVIFAYLPLLFGMAKIRRLA
jgi:Fuc2NAc and GlcNAc transferase